MLLQIMAISISLSIDALGIGVSYQLKGVRIPVSAKAIIGLISALIMGLSIYAGDFMLRIFPERVTTLFGIVVLCIIGLAFIRNGLFGDKDKTYDFNKSKTIDCGEAIALGAALSADSVSAGMAAAVLGLGNIWMPLTVGIAQVTFLCLGAFVISRLPLKHGGLQEKICGVFSGCLLILIAVLRGIG